MVAPTKSFDVCGYDLLDLLQVFLIGCFGAQYQRARGRLEGAPALAELVAGHGLASVTMSQIAKETGIGRATLYKYFPDVEAILIAWHDRQIGRHLQHLAAVRSQSDNPEKQLEAVLYAYAIIQHEHHSTELAALLHQSEHVARARQQLRDFLASLIAEGAKAGRLRDDIASSELASYCLHALAAASSLPSRAAVHRLVTVTMDGLRRTR